ncbi:ATP-binding protein [Streptomyces monashensis]|uniref:sensor histidine kinase n=1 Tax=Streptomyces monashensis TaxID=1678012 RepID=UPI0033E84CCC
MTPPTHAGDRPSLRTFFSVLAAIGVLSALVVCAAVAAAPDSVRTPLAWGAGAAAAVLSAAVATAAHGLRVTRGLRHRLESATRDLGRLLHQQARTSEETRQEQQRLIDELAQQRTEFTETYEAERARLERASGRETDRLRGENARLTAESEQARRERDTALAATSNAAGRLQALATATLADLRAMEDRHSDEDVLADLLQLDHRTAQAGRLADSVAVLTGARSGRRWARPIGMESILRGAMGRIAGYRRVRVHSAAEVAVAGHAAEGVMHALAELLDNAANFSPPTAEVHVYVEEVPAGVIVSVEDSGLVMGEVQLRRAERAVSGDVSGLGGLTGTRLGLAVVGRLARKHGLKVSFRPSARGGTGVLMLVPQDILTTSAPATAQHPTPPTPPAAVHQPAAAPPPADLPKRRRGQTLAKATRTGRATGTGTHHPASDTTLTPRPETGTDADRPAAAGSAAGTAAGTDPGRARAARFSSFRRAVRPEPSHTPEAAPRRTATDPAHTSTAEADPTGAAQPDTDRTASDSTGAPAATPADQDPGAVGPRDGREGDVPQGAVGGGRSEAHALAPDGTPGSTGAHGPSAPSHPHAHPEGDAT